MSVQIGPTHTAVELAAAARSYVYKSFASGLSFPSEDFSLLISSGQWVQDVGALTRHLPYEMNISEAVPLSTPVEARDLEQEYMRIFEVGPGGPFCAPYEGSHRHGRMKLMEELVRFYEHFGLAPEPGDQPDHLCAELEFMHYMSFKETAATARGTDIVGLRRAQRDFLSRHLCRWLPRLHARVASAREPAPFYEAMCSLVKRFCELDAAWLKAVGKSPTGESGCCPTDDADGDRR